MLPKGWSCWGFEASFRRHDSLEKVMKGRNKMEMFQVGNRQNPGRGHMCR